MHRTERKLLAFPPMYDGVTLRHQLYTLAPTHYATIHHNKCFERPELHILLNGSHELWSPLVALAALFEEVAGVGGVDIVDGISHETVRQVLKKMI